MPRLPENSRAAPIGPELFVYLSWQTREGEPLLADDQTQQATYQAIGTRTRLQLCRLLAIGGSETRIHMVFRFPASMPVSHLARISMEAAEEAIARLHGIMQTQTPAQIPIWEREYVLKTLSAKDISQPEDFLQRQIQEAEHILAGG